MGKRPAPTTSGLREKRTQSTTVFTTINPALFKEGLPQDFLLQGKKYGFEVLERKMASDLLNEMHADHAAGVFDSGGRRYLLKGPAGSGKTITLLQVVQHYRQQPDWLVFWMPSAKEWVDGALSLDDIASKWLDLHMSQPEVLALLQDCAIRGKHPRKRYTPRCRLDQMLREGIAALQPLRTLIDYCRELNLGLVDVSGKGRKLYVLFAIDEYNAFLSDGWRLDKATLMSVPATPFQNPVANFFRNLDQFRPCRGTMVAAVSSAFITAPVWSSGRNAQESAIATMTRAEFDALVTKFEQRRVVPVVPDADRTAIFALTGGLPRELARLFVDCWQGAPRFDAAVEKRYLEIAEPVYYELIRKLFPKPVGWKPGVSGTLLERSLVFAHQLYAERDTTTAPTEWVNSGLVVRNAAWNLVMSCKAAHLAFLKAFRGAESDALELFGSRF